MFWPLNNFQWQILISGNFINIWCYFCYTLMNFGDHLGVKTFCLLCSPLLYNKANRLLYNKQRNTTSVSLHFFNFSDAPHVEMALGKSISPGSIYEGGDVYFDCLVIASPKPKKILWFQDVSKQSFLCKLPLSVLLKHNSIAILIKKMSSSRFFQHFCCNFC